MHVVSPGHFAHLSGVQQSQMDKFENIDFLTQRTAEVCVEGVGKKTKGGYLVEGEEVRMIIKPPTRF